MFTKRKSTEEQDEKLNMMPLIDIVFLLLIYFMLTMTFVDDEKWIRHLLETRDGPGKPTQTLEKNEINICVYPAGAPSYESTVALDHWFKEERNMQQIIYRVGSSQIIVDSKANMEEELERVHDFITHELDRFEINLATRGKQDPIKVHCFSALPWQYAAAAYDAVRGYESGKGFNYKEAGDLLAAREFGFAPSEIRDAYAHQYGRELFRLAHLR